MIKVKTVRLDDIEIDILMCALIGYVCEMKNQMTRPIGSGMSKTECKLDIRISKSIVKKLGRKLKIEKPKG